MRLNSSRSVADTGPVGNSSTSRVIAICARWMLVDLSGSRKPLASPMLTTLPIQLRRRRPARKRRTLGSASGSPSTAARMSRQASSSDRYALENT